MNRNSDLTSGEVITMILLAFVVLVIGVAAGSLWERESFPTHYSSGYCAALEGVRLNDEACDVKGKVVMVK